jgi:tetratricopeptide (TPR) repeat protein
MGTAMKTLIKINSEPTKRSLSDNERMALESFGDAIRTSKGLPGQLISQANYEWGMVYLRAGHLFEAKMKFQEVLDSPGADHNLKAYAQLLNLHNWDQDHDAALRVLEKIVELEPSAKANCAQIKADIYGKLGRHDEALKLYDEAIAGYEN